jgi:alkylation response protein AidB-like acyl-CoA dehydrogenase
MVPAGAIADGVLLMIDDRLELVPADDRRTIITNLGSMPLADLPVTGGMVLAQGAVAAEAYDAALDEWLALTANALVGIGARGLEIGVDYVRERRAWGVPIGSFQGISHRLADSAAAVDGARLLAREAAWAASEDRARAAELAAMAFGFAHESARDATYHSLHFHGGYGFMMEYDIQLYYRRARAWASVFGEPRALYRRVADRRYGPVGS